MPIRSRRPTPAHAPAWVRARHWPAVTGVAGLAAAAIVAATLGAHPHATIHAKDVAAAGPSSASAAPASVAGQQSQSIVYGPAPVATYSNGPVLGNVVVATPTLPAGGALPSAGLVGVTAPAPADPATISGLAAGGIPVTALDAYERAAARELTLDPGCNIPWPLLAGIGRVESNHGRFAGAVLLSDGTSSKKIIGIPLDGSRSATIRDTDHGRLDGDPVYDRAVGPMQFIPSTWLSYGADGNGDGIKDPFNIYDAAAAAAHYLCVAGGDLSTLAGQTRAVLAYNHSSAYLALVLNLERAYAIGVPGLIVPVLPPQSATPSSGASTLPTSLPTAPGTHKPLPPVDPGPPLSAPTAPVTSTSPSPKPTTPWWATTTPTPQPSTPWWVTTTPKPKPTSHPGSTSPVSPTSTGAPSSSAPSDPGSSVPPSCDPSSSASSDVSGAGSNSGRSPQLAPDTSAPDSASDSSTSSGSSISARDATAAAAGDCAPTSDQSTSTSG